MDCRQKRILITGGAGFQGSHLCDRLIEDGHYVMCMDNLITGDMNNIGHLFGNPNFKFIKHDVTEYIYVEGALDYILHFASPASPVDYLEFPIQTLKVVALGTHKALGLANEKRAKFLLASSAEVYGDPLVNPQQEDYWGNVNPIGPSGVYDEAKRFAEALTMAYHRYYGVDTRIARIFNTYGPRMRADDGRAVSNLITQSLRHEPMTVYGDGTQTRSFCFVSDFVEGILKLMESDYHEPINLGNTEEVNILELAREILKITGNKTKIIIFKALPIDDPKVRLPDITRAKEILDWQPEISLEEGLLETINYFQGLQRKC